MSYTITTEITIETSPQVVSSILFDFTNYEQWSSWLRITGGPPRGKKATFYFDLIGSQLSVSAKCPEKTSTYTPKVTLASPSILKWSRNDKHKWALNSERTFEIIASKEDTGRCIFRQSEKFTGACAKGLSLTSYYSRQKESYELMNRELKLFAEKMLDSDEFIERFSEERERHNFKRHDVFFNID
ncbi:hypothetical protein CJU89_6772 [Yarrowia sp. B02]|nr:hypothetical protein CJU89_6772 [Yarrowia sp. B02]